MKKFKTIDYWISIVLIAGFAIAIIIQQDFEVTLTGYFVVGGWQVISMIIHGLNGWFTGRKGARYIYHWITLISIVTMPAGSIWILAFTAPFMAVFYTWLCWREVHIKMRRPMSLLK